MRNPETVETEMKARREAMPQNGFRLFAELALLERRFLREYVIEQSCFFISFLMAGAEHPSASRGIHPPENPPLRRIGNKTGK